MLLLYFFEKLFSQMSTTPFVKKQDTLPFRKKLTYVTSVLRFDGSVIRSHASSQARSATPKSLEWPRSNAPSIWPFFPNDLEPAYYVVSFWRVCKTGRVEKVDNDLTPSMCDIQNANTVVDSNCNTTQMESNGVLQGSLSVGHLTSMDKHICDMQTYMQKYVKLKYK